MYPKARQNKLLVEELSDETLVYDLKRHKAHCLNQTAVLVWNRCDGKTPLAQLARQLEDELGTSASEETVRLALDRLEQAHLLEEREGGHTVIPDLSRRQLVRKLGRMGVAVPVVLSIVTPAAAQATGITPGQCNQDPRANVGKCCTNQRECRASGMCNGPKC